ncbi:MAG: 2Fe-2S iron-sulfur cluster-binding protein [Pricia sp.]
MAKITFITQDNEAITAEADSGSVMELAVDNNVPGIDGDCGGVCSCGTCHVHVTPEDMYKVGAASAIEKDTLELDDNANAYSRLGCQIPISDALDGIVLTVAN